MERSSERGLIKKQTKITSYAEPYFRDEGTTGGRGK